VRHSERRADMYARVTMGAVASPRPQLARHLRPSPAFLYYGGLGKYKIGGNSAPCCLHHPQLTNSGAVYNWTRAGARLQCASHLGWQPARPRVYARGGSVTPGRFPTPPSPSAEEKQNTNLVRSTFPPPAATSKHAHKRCQPARRCRCCLARAASSRCWCFSRLLTLLPRPQLHRHRRLLLRHRYLRRRQLGG